MASTDARASEASLLHQLAGILRACQARPEDVDLHCSAASLLIDLRRPREAIGAAYAAVELAPEHARAQSELGRALFLAGEAEAALPHCAKAVVLAPRNIGAMVTFGAVLFSLGRLEEALEAALDAVALDPAHHQARVNLSLAFEALGQLDRADAQARRAIAIDPSPAARHNLAALRLSRGFLDSESWTLYEARLELTSQARALASVPRWGGEPLGQGTILLHAEQGFGDVIQFVRYASWVKQRVGRVILAVPNPLRRLLHGVAGVDQVVGPGTTQEFDAFCPVASLPRAFSTTMATIPKGPAYLTAAAEAVTRFRLPRTACLNVGLVWSGNPDFVHDRLRSISTTIFGVLQGLRGVTFHSLQKDGVLPFPMSDRMAETRDFADTAGLIAGLDLVIAVDTAVANLAGAMGKPVWLLSRFMGCWRWLRDRDDSPWYPTMRIFRQERPGDWRTVLEEVRTTLIAMAAERACPGPLRAQAKLVS